MADGQLLALDVQRPSFQLAPIEEAANTIKGGQLANQSAGLKNQSDTLSLDLQKQETGALTAYRAAAAAGDPNAADKLKGFPEQQDAIGQHVASLSAQGVAATKQLLDEYQTVFDTIDHLPPGSPDAAPLWNKEVDKLVQAGKLDPKDAAQAKQNPPGSQGYSAIRTHIDNTMKAINAHPSSLDPKIAIDLYSMFTKASGADGTYAELKQEAADLNSANGTNITVAQLRAQKVAEAQQNFLKAVPLVNGGMSPEEAAQKVAAPAPDAAAPPAAGWNGIIPWVKSQLGGDAPAPPSVYKYGPGGLNMPQAPAAAPLPATPSAPQAPAPAGVAAAKNMAPAPTPLPAPPPAPQAVAPAPAAATPGRVAGPMQSGQAQPLPDGILHDAEDAIAQGADPDAVVKKIIDEGYDPSTLKEAITGGAAQ